MKIKRVGHGEKWGKILKNKTLRGKDLKFYRKSVA